jgi:hypothetical protein
MNNLPYRISRKIQKTLFREQWSLKIDEPQSDSSVSILPPPDRIWADPFPVRTRDITYIFIEQQYAGQNGTLGYVELGGDYSVSEFKPILERGYHLSYPCVFESDRDGERGWWMIPETNENRAISLYRASRFPDRWEKHSDIVTGVEAVDSTPFFHHGKWWLFTSCRSAAGSFNDSLSVYFSDSLVSGSWKAHPGNPVVTGTAGSRMAGKIFIGSDGIPVRPAQSCVREYGESVVLNKILVLSNTEYSELAYRTISPEAGTNEVCTHTYNPLGSIIFRDVKTRKFRPW